MQGITTVLVAALLNTALLPLTHAQQLRSAQTARTLALEQATSPTAAASGLRQSHEGLPISEPNSHGQRSFGNASADDTEEWPR